MDDLKNDVLMEDTSEGEGGPDEGLEEDEEDLNAWDMEEDLEE